MYQSNHSTRVRVCFILLTATWILFLNRVLLRSTFLNVAHEESTSHSLEFSKKVPESCGAVRWSRRNLPVTGLVSFPGSGNTWLRFLIQEATGVYTGSEYHDTELRMRGFLAEGVANSSTIVVKTHGSDVITRDRYEKAVLLIRHPKGAIKAEFNRIYGGGHKSTATPDFFEKYWPEFYSDHQRAWVRFHEDWQTYRRPLLVVLYRDLVQQTSVQLREVLTFLKADVDEERLNCAVACGNVTRRPTSSQLPVHVTDNNQSVDAIYQHVINIFKKSTEAGS
ncbi:WSCD family member GA21586-like [Physella acuta]|uniref:WSCD family member GA21586-like n=1 Tax=Physella acuta TaxID=109671 RepID=UPI0027DAD96B|nr:WSCD family member GA21586-like [Physella acuta]